MARISKPDLLTTRQRMLAIPAILAALAATAGAEFIQLRSGGTLEGPVLAVTDQSVLIEWGYQERVIPKGDLAPAVENALEAARAALARKDFREATDLCTQYLLWHPKHDQAQALRQQIHDAEIAALSQSFHAGGGFPESIARLKSITSQDDLPVLHEMLANHPHPRGRRGMAWVLAHIKSDQSIDPLLKALANDGNERARRICIFALGEIRSVRAVPQLIRTMRLDTHHLVRWWAGDALHKIGTPDALAAIQQAAPKEKNVSARNHLRYFACNPGYSNHRLPEISRGQVVEGYCKGTRYLVYVPRRYKRSAETRLMVAVHGTYSWPEGYIKICQKDAERYRFVLLAPHFEFGRFPWFGGLNVGRHRKGRSDLRLLEIIEDLSTVLPFDKQRILLFGHSEGGQFVHRFALAHPQRVYRAVAGAAGHWIHPDADLRFPLGTKTSPYALDLNQLDFGQLVRTNLVAVVGTQDSSGHLDKAERFMNDVQAWASEHATESNIRFLPVVGGHDGMVEYTEARKFLFARDLDRFDDNRVGPRTIERQHLLNLSRHARATASSAWGSDYTADRANDGEFSTRWNSAHGETDNAWLELTWPQPVVFDRVTVDEFMPPGPRIQRWRLEAGMTRLREIARGSTIGVRHKVALPTRVRAKRLRFVVEKASNTPTIVELMPHMAFWEN